MRWGIDWGGTKIELAGIDDTGAVVYRKRMPTPRNDYPGCVTLVADLVREAETLTGEAGTVGLGIPGTVSPYTGLTKNSNSVWMNGMPLKDDLELALSRPVRIANDANCFAVSEAHDGAGAGANVVVGLIIGTGCGAGVVINGRPLTGANGIGGEFGHLPLAPMNRDEYPGPKCWCGRFGCHEVFVSGTGFALDYQRRSGEKAFLDVQTLLKRNDAVARETMDVYCDRLARAIATIVNTVDPDVIVLGGGMSNIDALYERLPDLVVRYAFGGEFHTPIVRNVHGDSSGVRGAAWLWPLGDG